MSRFKVFLEAVKFEHTVFALPFAYLGMTVAERKWPSLKIFILVTLAMASARSAAMLLNRLIDLKFDARNPRTSRRPIVTGELPLAVAWAGVGICAVLFFLSTWFLNPLCVKLSPIALVLLTGYSYVKRFSLACHFVLGMVLSIAPFGGWIAVTGVFSWIPVLLSLAILFWVGGFDIIYSLQDLEFDRSQGLHSIPVSFGEKTALRISGLSHAAAISFFAFFGLAAHLGWVYWVGVGLVAVLLKIEHRLVEEGDLSKIDTAFFTINGWIGILLFIFTFLEIYR